MPNNLLVPLGSWEFNVTDTDSPPVSRSFPAEPTDRDRFLGNLLVAITTNEERDLPEAFLRRCVIYRLEHPDRDRLVEIAKRHLEVEGAKLGKKDTELLKAIADKVEQFREQARNERVRAPGTAEYLDAVRACRNLNISVGSGVWERIAETVLRKWESGEERKR